MYVGLVSTLGSLLGVQVQLFFLLLHPRGGAQLLSGIRTVNRHMGSNDVCVFLCSVASRLLMTKAQRGLFDGPLSSVPAILTFSDNLC